MRKHNVLLNPQIPFDVLITKREKRMRMKLFTMQAWLSRYSITSTSCRLRVAPACSCLWVIFRDVGDILDSVWRRRQRELFGKIKK